MIDIDQCYMEVADPRSVWIMLMGYEVDGNIMKLYAEHLLNSPLDPKLLSKEKENVEEVNTKQAKGHEEINVEITKSKEGNADEVVKEENENVENINVSDSLVFKDTLTPPNIENVENPTVTKDQIKEIVDGREVPTEEKETPKAIPEAQSKIDKGKQPEISPNKAKESLLE